MWFYLSRLPLILYFDSMHCPFRCVWCQMQTKFTNINKIRHFANVTKTKTQVKNPKIHSMEIDKTKSKKLKMEYKMVSIVDDDERNKRSEGSTILLARFDFNIQFEHDMSDFLIQRQYTFVTIPLFVVLFAQNRECKWIVHGWMFVSVIWKFFDLYAVGNLCCILGCRILNENHPLKLIQEENLIFKLNRWEMKKKMMKHTNTNIWNYFQEWKNWFIDNCTSDIGILYHLIWTNRCIFIELITE